MAIDKQPEQTPPEPTISFSERLHKEEEVEECDHVRGLNLMALKDPFYEGLLDFTFCPKCGADLRSR